MASESIHQKLERVRKPRVHIKYEVETEGGSVLKELPFVVGVMGDYSGNASKKQKTLKERKFINIDRDNLNEVMERVGPALNLRVENTLNDDGSDMAVQLEFNSMEDFEPAQVVAQVPALKELQDARNKLRDLLTKADRSDDLEDILEETLKSDANVRKLAEELGIAQ